MDVGARALIAEVDVPAGRGGGTWRMFAPGYLQWLDAEEAHFEDAFFSGKAAERGVFAGACEREPARARLEALRAEVAALLSRSGEEEAGSGAAGASSAAEVEARPPATSRSGRAEEAESSESSSSPAGNEEVRPDFLGRLRRGSGN